MTELRVLINSIWGCVGVFLGAFLGGLNGVLSALIVFMAADYITGVLAAARAHNLSSNVGFWGLIRKGCMLLIVGIANTIDTRVLDGSGMCRNAACLFYVSNEGISILENIVALGVRVPQKLKDILQQINDDGGVK